jgi:hypothetical protein
MRTLTLDLDDDTVHVEVEVVGAPRASGSPFTPVGKQSDSHTSDAASERVSSLVLARAIRAVGSRLRAELVALSDPDELVLEFGASLKGGATVLLSAEGTFKVQLKWIKRHA